MAEGPAPGGWLSGFKMFCLLEPLPYADQTNTQKQLGSLCLSDPHSMPLMSFDDQKLQAPCEFIEMIVPLIIAAIVKLLLYVLYLYT